MLRKLGMLLAAGTLAIGFGLGHSGHTYADPGNGNNCVGAAVSFNAHDTQQVFGEGFGDLAHDLGLNPGQLIQQYATASCGKHGG